MSAISEFPAADFYDCDAAAERLQYTTPEDAVERWLDSHLDFKKALEPQLQAMKLVVYCYKRSSGPDAGDLERLAWQLEDQIHEWWYDNGWADPEEAPESPEGFTASLQAVLKQFTTQSQVWSCNVDASVPLTRDQVVAMVPRSWFDAKDAAADAAAQLAADRDRIRELRWESIRKRYE